MSTRRMLLSAIVLVTLLGIGHHVDHIIRGNHVGWPITDNVTPFTYSLGFYPVIVIGFALTLVGKVGAGFWAVLAAIGFVFVGLTHLGPVALEPPEDIVEGYDSAVAGWFAFGWLLLFLTGLAAVTTHAIWLRRNR